MIQFIKATFLCLAAIMFQPLLYVGLAEWVVDGQLNLPAQITFIVFLTLTAPICIYFAYWRYDYLVKRLKFIDKKQPFTDRLFILIILNLILGSYFYAATRPSAPLNDIALYSGVGLLLAGLFFVGWVMFHNPYSSVVIAKHDDHKLIDTGPYALVRHPMYFGFAIAFTGWALMFQQLIFSLGILAAVFLFIYRLHQEEKFLEQNLTGYSDYQKRVRHRIFPLIY